MREEEVSHLLTEVENGDREALKVYAELKQHRDLYDQAVKKIEPLAMSEAEQYPEKSFEHCGFVFEKRAGGVTYSYKEIPAWKVLKEELTKVEQQAKQAYLAKQKGILNVTEDGEMIDLPSVTYRKDSLIIKNKK